MRSRQGFTMLEVMVAIGIIAVLVAILVPVLANSRRQAGVTVCINNLKQMNHALALYRMECEPITDIGSPSMMGLPPVAPVLMRRIEPRPRCAGFRADGPPGYTFLWPAPIPPENVITEEQEKDWAEYARLANGNPVVIYDESHSDGHRVSEFVTHRLLALYLDGSVKIKVKKGRHWSYDFWLP